MKATRTDDSVTVVGKEAGLGDEEQVSILLTGTAECINKGAKHPKAANKESLSEQGEFPVQNGKAEFELTLTASFSPGCAPPMTVVFSNVTLTDTTNGISKNLGSFYRRARGGGRHPGAGGDSGSPLLVAAQAARDTVGARAQRRVLPRLDRYRLGPG